MSQENVDLHRRNVEVWHARDFEAFIATCDPRIAFHTEFSAVGGGYHGHDGLRKFLRDFEDGWWALTGQLDGPGRDGRGSRYFLSAWEDFRPEAEEYREIDGERVLVLLHHRGRGKASGLELAQMQTNNAALFHVRDGKVTRF